MFFWPLRSLVSLWKVFTSPSFPYHIGICLSHFECFSQVMVALIGWHEWCALAFSRLCKKYFGVSVVKSSGSSLTAVRSLAMRVCSTTHIVVLNTSSPSLRLSKISIMTFLQLWPCLSQIPPKWGAPGGLNFQTIFFCANSLSIFALSHSFMNAFSSLAAPTRFVPLSLLMVFGQPRLAMNPVTAARHNSVSNDCTTLMCTDLVLKQVKRQHHIFLVRRRNLTSKGPLVDVSAVWVNGNTCSLTRSRGRSAIGGWIG